MRVPFADLGARYSSIKPEIDSAISKVISGSSFIGGEFVSAFEKEFAAFTGAAHCIGCANGTDALELALQAYGIKKGDEVIVPALTWISTAEAVSNVGATPVFADVLPDTYTIDPQDLEKKVTPAAKCIIPVHLYGHPADMDAIMRIARERGLTVIEDCAQAHGARYKGRRCGSIGHAAAFSFYPGKNLGAYGDAGAVVTNDEQIAVRVRMLGNHGQLKKHDHRLIGRNSRLDGLQAAILSVHLGYLEQWNQQRKKAAALYSTNLQHIQVTVPVISEGCDHVFHLYVIRCSEREKLAQQLKDSGIETAVHYPRALPSLEIFGSNPSPAFPAASSACSKLISLPMFPSITSEQVTYVCEQVAKHCRK